MSPRAKYFSATCIYGKSLLIPSNAIGSVISYDI